MLAMTRMSGTDVEAKAALHVRVLCLSTFLKIISIVNPVKSACDLFGNLSLELL